MSWRNTVVINLALSFMCGCLAAVAQAPGQDSSAAQQETADLSKTYIAQMEERVTTLEERVMGLEHPIDSLLSRVEGLENETFGGAVKEPVSLEARIIHLESVIYSRPPAKRMPDGMESYVDNSESALNSHRVHILAQKHSKNDTKDNNKTAAARTASSRNKSANETTAGQ